MNCGMVSWCRRGEEERGIVIWEGCCRVGAVLEWAEGGIVSGGVEVWMRC